MIRFIKEKLSCLFTLFRFLLRKMCFFSNFKFSLIECFSPFSVVCLERKSKVFFGKSLLVRRGTKIVVRKGGELSIGNCAFINYDCVIACRQKIVIGDNTQIGPKVCIYDHDHDYKGQKGYVCSDVIIGKNVWIGAGSVILRGCIIGDNSIIAAGSVVKCIVPPNTVLIQKKENILTKYECE